jgi:hypothetical protein
MQAGMKKRVLAQVQTLLHSGFHCVIISMLVDLQESIMYKKLLFVKKY